jgi:putative component of membrane protein insertase Oxa1/YidC/SpoIIIJ protein YidD
MEPSCSNYSIKAIHKHGVFLGVLLTADRLYHEGSIKKTSPHQVTQGRVKYLDPVENNDFWWYEKN